MSLWVKRTLSPKIRLKTGHSDPIGADNTLNVAICYVNFDLRCLKKTTDFLFVMRIVAAIAAAFI